MDMFRNAADSMRRQTIGFENVEWIIVAHNCEPQYMPLLTEMFKDDQNVVVRELNNEARTPSSPRNYGMTLATAPYLGFLDGDDSYTPNCLEETIRNMQETDSQIVCFRREFELQDDSLNVVTEVVGWNQTLSRIVISRDNWDDEKMFCGFWGMATSKLFESRFLQTHGVKFDEEVPFAEDMLFCAEAIANADRICYLPQLIGYHYFINGASLVQSESKSGETLIGYARGFVKFFSTLQRYGISCDEIVMGLSLRLSQFMLASSDRLTLEHRQEIKRLLGPFISRVQPLRPSKTVTEEFAEMAYVIPHEVIMNPEGGISNFMQSVANGLPRLKSILKANRDTDYGQRYAFGSLQTIEGYQHRVPLTDYDSYAHLIRLQTNIGESGILTTARAERYVRKKSGKLLPLTAAHVAPYDKAFATTLLGHHSLLLAASHPLGRATGDRAMVDTLESILVKDFISTYYYTADRKVTSLVPSLNTRLSIGEQYDLYAVMLEAIADRDIGQMVAMTTSDLLEVFRVLEDHWQPMVEAISQNDPARADELRRALADGMEGVATRIWPSLRRTVGFGASRQQNATAQLRRYTKGIPHNHGYYFTAETMMAKAVADDSDVFRLITDNDLLEFIPCDNTAATPVLLSETKEGASYRVVVTNQAGLYRFKTSHKVTIVEKDLMRGVLVTID